MYSTSIVNNSDPLLVDKEAQLILLVYEDYQCGYCGKAFEELKALRNTFKENINVVYRHFPCTNSHPSALLAALVAEASGLQNKFMEVHDTLFEFQLYLEYGLEGILGIIEKKHAISVKQLLEDIENPSLKAKVNDDINWGLQMGVKNTPAIFINNHIYKGAIKSKELSTAIRQQIS